MRSEQAQAELIARIEAEKEEQVRIEKAMQQLSEESLLAFLGSLKIGELMEVTGPVEPTVKQQEQTV